MMLTTQTASPLARLRRPRMRAEAIRTTVRGALAGLALIATGCQTMQTERGPERLGLSSPSGKPDPKAPKTDFHATVGAEQQYQVHIDIGRLQETNGNFEAALAEYQKAIDVCRVRGSYLSPRKNGPVQEALAERKLAGALDRLGRFAQAETHYEKAITLTPNDARIWNDVGYSFALQNRWDDSERALKQADAMEPNNQKTLTNLGLTLAKLGKTSEALETLTKASGPAIAHANLGYILAAMGKTKEARAQYQEAITLQPQLTAPQVALAKLDRDASQAAPALAADAPAPADPVMTRAANTLKTPTPAVAPSPAPSAPSLVPSKPLQKPVAPTPPTPAPVVPNAPSAAREATPDAPEVVAAVAPPQSTALSEPIATATAPNPNPNPLTITSGELSQAPALAQATDPPEAGKDAEVVRTSYVPSDTPSACPSVTIKALEPAPSDAGTARPAPPVRTLAIPIDGDFPVLPPLNAESAESM